MTRLPDRRTGICTAVVLLLSMPGRPFPARASAPERFDAVVLKDERSFIAKGLGRAEYSVRRVVEIRSEAGNRYARTWVPEDSFVRVKELKGVLRDTEGRELRRLRDSDVHVFHNVDAVAFHSDRGGRSFELTHRAYPYLFESSYVLDFNTLFVWPAWEPQTDVPVREATLTVVAEKGVEFRTTSRGVPDPEARQDGGRHTYTWKVGPLAAELEEDYAPPEERVQTYVRFAPSAFEVGGTRGRLDSWDGLASWYEALSSGRCRLADSERDEVRALVGEVASTPEKVAALYSHLQRRCRYVAIELNVGGWQPHRASDTYRNRYGDCKDLSTLMIAMLNTVGVEAFPVLTLTRDRGVVDPLFPSNRFDHCIVLVPASGDSLWLECTSKLHRPGDLPAAVEGSDVLVVTKAGGVLTRTPSSSANDNRRESLLEGELHEDGTLALTFRCTATGNQADVWRSHLVGKNAQETRDWARAIVGRYLPALRMDRVDLDGVTGDSAGAIELCVTASAPGFALIQDFRMIVNPVVLHRVSVFRTPGPAGRQRPVRFPYAFVDRDSASIRLPPGCRLETPAERREVGGPEGHFRMEYTLEKGVRFRWAREFRIDAPHVPVEQYAGTARIFSEASRYDARGIALVVPADGRSR